MQKANGQMQVPRTNGQIIYFSRVFVIQDIRQNKNGVASRAKRQCANATGQQIAAWSEEIRSVGSAAAARARADSRTRQRSRRQAVIKVHQSRSGSEL